MNKQRKYFFIEEDMMLLFFNVTCCLPQVDTVNNIFGELKFVINFFISIQKNEITFAKFKFY